jgi:hypothetical protein
MKKFFITLAFVSTLFSCEAIWNNGPTQLLKDIFEATKTIGVENLESAVKQSNFKWIRPKGFELWDVYSLFDDAQRAKLTEIVKNSSLAKAKMPTKKHYDAVVVFGATTARVRDRIAFLMKLHQQGITWNKVYLLGSTRNLKIGNDSDKEMAKILETKGALATEMAMVNEIWQQTPKPDSFKDIPNISIQSGQRPDGSRASAEDTLREMTKEFGDVNGKEFLFISNNPYISYQDAVAKKVLGQLGVVIETAGEAMTTTTTMENVLDTVARCLKNIQR